MRIARREALNFGAGAVLLLHSSFAQACTITGPKSAASKHILVKKAKRLLNGIVEGDEGLVTSALGEGPWSINGRFYRPEEIASVTGQLRNNLLPHGAVRKSGDVVVLGDIIFAEVESFDENQPGHDFDCGAITYLHHVKVRFSGEQIYSVDTV